MLEPANTKLISSHNGVAAALVCSGPDRGRAMAARIRPRPRAVAHQVIGGRGRGLLVMPHRASADTSLGVWASGR